MSPLMMLIMTVMRIGAYFVSLMMFGMLALVVWQKTQFENWDALSRQDYTFLTVVLLLALGCLWMARSVSREIRLHAPKFHDPKTSTGLDRGPSTD